MSTNTLHSKVIRQVDESWPAHLDFARLREEGLRHIGDLAGRIWTDHNTHDPGITTLEVLCYALLDLGYRTQLPIEDLLAQKDGAAEDNFFTPAQILSCNPLTITDYRKLLMELEGVRNAWLEPVEKRNPRLYLDGSGKLCCCECEAHDDRTGQSDTPGSTPSRPENDCGCKGSSTAPGKNFIDLNGLYHIYLEMEQEWFQKIEEEDTPKKKEEAREEFLDQVRCLLSAHRNLGEDFESITILCPQNVGLCADVEILPGTDTEKTYFEILRRIIDFISPTARFYSLQSLLEKGRPIEEIFAGRPYSLKTILEKTIGEDGPPDFCKGTGAEELEEQFRSFGFLDTEELEGIERTKEIHLSDLYSVIHSVPGVRSVKNLCLNTDVTHVPLPHLDCGDEKPWPQAEWRFRLLQNAAPIFLFDNTSLTNISLSTATGAIPVNKRKVHAELTRYQKSYLSDSFLDMLVPKGAFREDLPDYISIQNEFPRVYGIGETGLPESASLLRRVQARQFQGYLLFFDQLLADYLQQLSRLRDLFSLKQESQRPEDARHTLFSAVLNQDNTPGFQKLNRFFAAKDQGIVEGSVLALPVRDDQALTHALSELEATLNGHLVIKAPGACLEYEKGNCDEEVCSSTYGYVIRRDSDLNLVRRSLEEKNYTIDLRRDRAGWFFILRFPSISGLVLVGVGRYERAQEAENAAQLAAFLGMWENNLSTSGYDPAAGGDRRHTFSLVSREMDYVHILQEMLENQSAYIHRREGFLDHLLARFSEKFTDYAVMLAGMVQDEQMRRRTSVEDKSRFLSKYDDISRNRGRAFDYLQPAWGTDNISGYERRAMLLSGFTDDRRQSLCNIEVFEKGSSFRVVLDDWHNSPLLASLDTITSDFAAESVAAALHETLLSDRPFQVGYDPLTQKYTLSIRAGYVSFAYPNPIDSEFEALEKAKQIKALFAVQSVSDNVQVSRYAYVQELHDAQGSLVHASERQFATNEDAQAQKQLKAFISDIPGDANGRSRKLSPMPVSAGRYLDMAAFNRQILPCPTRWKWHRFEQNTRSYLSSEAAFLSESEAWADIAKNMPEGGAVYAAGNGRTWEIAAEDGTVLQSERIFSDIARANTAWRQAKEWGQKTAYYIPVFSSDGKAFHIELRSDTDAVLASTQPADAGNSKPEILIEAFAAIFSNKKAKPRTPAKPDCWGFRLNNDKGEPLLLSYALYPSASEALRTGMETHKDATETGRYVKSGDETNLHYIYLLKDAHNQFIAESPQPFDSAAERDKVLQATVKILKKSEAPLQVRREAPSWAFALADEKERLILQSVEEYESETATGKAFEDFLCDLADMSQVKAKGNLIQTETASARVHSGDATRAAKSLSDAVTAQVFAFDVRKTPAGYRFYYYWDGPDGSYEPLFESMHEFTRHEEAEQAFGAFAKNLHLATLEKPGKGKTTALTLKMGEEPVAKATAAAGGDPARVESFLDYRVTHPAGLMESYSKWVQPPQGRPEYAYRLVKKGHPFAVWACNPHLNPPDDCYPDCKEDTLEGGCYEPKPVLQYDGYRPKRACWPDKAAAANEVSKICLKKPHDFTWLDICFGAADVIQKRTGENCICKYHFIIKGAIGDGPELVLFQSITGYDTEALAVAAYQEKFLEILQAASCEDNYGQDRLICTQGCFELQPDSCGKIGNYIAAVADNYDNATPAQIEQLVKWAKSFPVRFFEVWENGIKRKKYYFRLFNIPSGSFEWQSWECYDSFNEAWQGFKKLMQLLACGDHCRAGQIEPNCDHAGEGVKYQVEIREVLATGQWCYQTEDEAWGRDLCDQIAPSCPCEEPEEEDRDDVYEPLARPEQPGSALFAAAFINPEIPPKDVPHLPDLPITDHCCKLAVHPCRHTEEELSHLPMWNNTSQTPQEKFLNAITAVLLGVLQSAYAMKNGLYAPIVNYQPTQNLEFLRCEYFLKGELLYNTREEALSAAAQIIARIKSGNYHIKINFDPEHFTYGFELYDACCHYGAERFLAAAQNDEACYSFEETDPESGKTRFGYYIVDECYRVAVHPCAYDSEAKAQAALDQLMAELNDLIATSEAKRFIINKTEGRHFLKITRQRTRPDTIIPAVHTDKAAPPIAESPITILDPCDEDAAPPFECDTLLAGVKGFKTESGALSHAHTLLRIHSMTGTPESRYQYIIVPETECGPWTIQLVDTCCVLAKSPCLFNDKYTRDSSMAAVKACTAVEGMHLLEHILLRPCVEDCKDSYVPNQPCTDPDDNLLKPCNPCLLQGCPDMQCTLCWVDNPFEKDPCEKEQNPPLSYLPFADLYSFWATLMLPSWMKRFHDADARSFFQHVLYKEAPAHIALNIVWLSPRQMCRFEDTYRLWLTWMRCPDNDMDCSELPDCCGDTVRLAQYEGQNPSRQKCNLRCCMVKCLTALIPYHWCEPGISDKEPCDCAEKIKSKVQDDRIVKQSSSNYLQAENGHFLHLFRCHPAPAKAQDKQPEITHRSILSSQLETIAAIPLTEAPKSTTEARSIAVESSAPALEKKKEEPPAPANGAAAERRSFNSRIQERKAEVMHLESKISDPEIFHRIADSFLNSEARFSEFKKHATYLLDQTDDLSSAELPETILLKNAVWHLLDKAVEQDKEGAPFAHEKEFKALLAQMKVKGFKLRELAQNWDQAGKVSGVFGKSAVNRYLKWLK